MERGIVMRRGTLGLVRLSTSRTDRLETTIIKINDNLVLTYEDSVLVVVRKPLDNVEVVIDLNGDMAWYKNDELHRDNGKPAIVCVDGYKAWYINGKRVKKERNKWK